MPDINQIIQAHRELLLSRDKRLLTEISSLYLSAADRIVREIDGLLSRINDARASGAPVSPAWLVRERRLSGLLGQVAGELRRFSSSATASVAGEQRAQVELAARHTVEVLGAQGGVEATFRRLPERAVEAIVGATSDGSPLRSLFDRFGRETGVQLREEVVQGVALGQGTERTARRIRELLDGNGARARTIARTETIRAYREAGFQTAQENDDILRGWTWIAALHGSCAACIAMHGTFHKPDERLTSHPNCRCSPRWETRSFAELGISGVGETAPARVEHGADWFRAQPEDVKREVLGKAGYDAYRAGKLKLEDLVGRSQDPRWGPQYFTRSLRDALRGGGAFPGYAPAKKPRPSKRAPAPAVQTSAPVTLPSAPKPAGSPIGPRLKFVKAKKLERVAALIDQVHGDGQLPEIPVQMDGARKRWGAFWHHLTLGRPIKITVSRYGTHPELTLAHEVGHFLDYSGIGSAGRFASQVEVVMSDWWDVVRKSSAIRELMEMRQKGSYLRNGIKYPVDRRYVDYLLSNHEIWARAYAQYIAMKSGDKAMLDGLDRVRNYGGPGGLSQWTDADFAPIMKAIDDLFEKLGWRRP